MNSFKSPDSKKRSKLDELMGTSHSKGKNVSRNKMKRSPMKRLRQNFRDSDSQNYSSRKNKKKGSKKRNFGEEDTKIYSKMGEDSMKFGEGDLGGGSMTMVNTKSELSVKSSKTHGGALGRNRPRKKSPINVGKIDQRMKG